MSTVGVRGRAADGSELVLRFTQLPSVAQRPGDAYTERVRVTVEDSTGRVVAELSVGEATLAKAISRLLEDKIRAAWAFYRQTDQVRQPQALPGSTRTLDVRKVAAVGVWVAQGISLPWWAEIPRRLAALWSAQPPPNAAPAPPQPPDE